MCLHFRLSFWLVHYTNTVTSRQHLLVTHSQYTSLKENCLQTVSVQTLFSSLHDMVICTIRVKMKTWHSYKLSSLDDLYCECVKGTLQNNRSLVTSYLGSSDVNPSELHWVTEWLFMCKNVMLNFSMRFKMRFFKTPCWISGWKYYLPLNSAQWAGPLGLLQKCYLNQSRWTCLTMKRKTKSIF